MRKQTDLQLNTNQSLSLNEQNILQQIVVFLSGLLKHWLLSQVRAKVLLQFLNKMNGVSMSISM